MTVERRPSRVRRALHVAQREHEQRLLHAAHHRGLLSDEQLDALADEDEPLPAATTRGWLRADQLAALEQAVARDDFARPALDEVALPPDDPALPDLDAIATMPDLVRFLSQ